MSRATLRSATSLLADLAGLLTELAHGAARRLPQITDRLSGPLAEATDGLPGTAGELPDSTARTERLPCRIRQTADGLARHAARLHCFLCRLPHIAQGLADGATGAQCFLTDVSDATERVIDRLDKTLQDLGIPIQRRERPIQNVVQVLQPHLELALRLDALDVYLNLAQVDVNPGHHLEQVGELGPKGQMRLQLLDVNVDLIDLHLRDIDKDVGVMARLAPLKL